MSFLIPEIYLIFFTDLILLALMLYCLPLSIDIAKNWNPDSTSEKQYRLEKSTHVAATVIRYMLFLKLPMFIIFIYANDKMSNVLPGAMCAAGVISATVYGKYLLYLKIFNIYAFSLWAVIDHTDNRIITLPFTKLKFGIFPFLFIFLCAETLLFFITYSAIDPTTPVSCCNTLFSAESSGLMSYDGRIVFFLFCGVFALLFTAFIFKFYRIYSILNIAYLFMGILSLIVFTGTYVYELPTHKCPFCIIQSGYHYVGYLFYALLFTGTFTGMAAGVLRFLTGTINRKMFLASLIGNILYIALSAGYILRFYIINKTWL